MTTEEKLSHFYDFSMDSAKKEADQVLKEYQAALDKIFDEHKEAKERLAARQLDDETSKLQRELNKALSAEQLDIKRALSKKKNEIKDALFLETRENLITGKSDPTYLDYLCRKIKDSVEFAAGDEMIIYIDPSDEALIPQIKKQTGVTPTISKEIFDGGMRAVIASKNILIDNSFVTLLQDAKNEYTFDGGKADE